MKNIINPAIGPNIANRCLARKTDGTYCLASLDACAQHAQICKVEGANIHRHDTVRDGIIPALKRHVTSVKTEQFIYEQSQLDENTGGTNEARMDIISEMSQLRSMLDIRVLFQRFVADGNIREHTRWKNTNGM